MMGLKAVLSAILALFSAVVLAVSAVDAQQAPPNPRIALVIGNVTYPDEALATTANDAGLVAQTLQAAGFDVVGARDLDGQSLRTAFRDFLDKAAAAGPDMEAFVYLSGRGVQFIGDNYFVPVDARINRDADVAIEAVRISDFVHALATLPGRARIVVLDAARANPYAAQGAPLAPGLALVDPEPGVLVAFNAAPGTLAGDEQGPYGVYGKTLAGALRQGGVDLAEVFDQTRVLVNTETRGALLPWSASKLDGPYYVFERAADAPPPPVLSAEELARRPLASLPVDEAYAAALQHDTIAAYAEFLAAFPHSDQARRVRAILAARREAAFWRRTADINTPRAYWTYLRAYPRGPHVADARRRLAYLSARYEPPPDFVPEVYVNLPPPPPDELFYQEQPFYAFDEFGPPPPPPPVYYVYQEYDVWNDLPPPPPPVVVGVLPVLVAIPLIAGAVAYHRHDHDHDHDRDGIAPPGSPRLPVRPLAPPPLPVNVKPVAPPAPLARGPNMAIVKPLPPIGTRLPGAGVKPVALPAQPAGGNPPAATPPTPAATSATPAGAPVTGAKPLPVTPPASKVGNAPAVTPPTPAAVKPAGANNSVIGAKPLPVPPSATKVGNPSAVTPPTAVKPTGAIAPPLGAKPLPVPPLAPGAGNPAATAPSVTKPPGAPPAAAVVAPVGKPLTVAPSTNGGQTPPSKRLTSTPPQPLNKTTIISPNAGIKPVGAAPLSPVQRQPMMRPVPATVHAPPPSDAMTKTAPAASRPPVVRWQPPPQPVRPPPQVLAHPPACGKAGLPACPK